jgi:hypothetical protein
MSPTLPRRVAILVHARDVRPERRPYQIWGIADVWRSWGIQVVVSRGIARAIDADVVVNHVDLTVVPEPYVQFMARYPVAINGRCTDISKRTVSTNLVRPGDAWAGPVIVKTDRNHGGRPERRLGWGRIGLLLSADTWRPRARWRTRSMLMPNDYPIFTSLEEVPRDVWRNPALVVERFLPERDGDLFVVRTMALFGDRWINRRRLSASPIVKARHVIRAEEVEPHPGAFEAAKRLGLDRGKIDYVVQDGRAVVFDVNRTNTMAAFTRTHRLQACRRLAEGLLEFWPPARDARVGERGST